MANESVNSDDIYRLCGTEILMDYELAWEQRKVLYLVLVHLEVLVFVQA